MMDSLHEALGETVDTEVIMTSLIEQHRDAVADQAKFA